MPPRYRTYRTGFKKTIESIEKARERSRFALEKDYVPDRDFVVKKIIQYEGGEYALAKDGRIFIKTDGGFTGISEGRQNDIRKALRL